MIRQIPLNLKKKLKKKVLQLNTIKEEVNAVKEVEKIVPEENGAAENIVVIEVVVTIIKDHKRMMMVLLFRQMRNQNLVEEVATVVTEVETEVVIEEIKAIEVVSVKVPEVEIAQEKRAQLNPLNNSKISNE
jgi:hypothetical protein